MREKLELFLLLVILAGLPIAGVMFCQHYINLTSKLRACDEACADHRVEMCGAEFAVCADVNEPYIKRTTK